MEARASARARSAIRANFEIRHHRGVHIFPRIRRGPAKNGLVQKPLNVFTSCLLNSFYFYYFYFFLFFLLAALSILSAAAPSELSLALTKRHHATSRGAWDPGVVSFSIAALLRPQRPLLADAPPLLSTSSTCAVGVSALGFRAPRRKESSQGVSREGSALCGVLESPKQRAQLRTWLLSTYPAARFPSFVRGIPACLPESLLPNRPAYFMSVTPTHLIAYICYPFLFIVNKSGYSAASQRRGVGRLRPQHAFYRCRMPVAFCLGLAGSLGF